METIQKWLDYDFSAGSVAALRKWTLAGTIFLVVFGVYDLLFDTGSGFYHQLSGWLSRHENPLAAFISDAHLPVLVWVLFAVLAVYISAFSLITFFLTEKRYGAPTFHRIFITHLLSNVVSTLLTLIFFSLIGVAAWLCGFDFSAGYDGIGHLYQLLSGAISHQVPTLTILPYPLALLLGMIMGGLPGYLAHWLGHQSRLVWYLNHRCHHTAEVMHPAGIGPFMFLPELFSNIPSALLGAVCSKLFYYEPLLADTFLLGFLNILIEKFNHSTAGYDIAFGFKPVRWLSAYFGGGVYHYMHHSAVPGHEVVNIGGGPFLFWDRVFGTYCAPTPEAPPVGLTGQPPIRLSPLAIVLSGWQQLWYEWQHNRDWRIRWRILFGGIYYKPPVTKDFLIVGEKQF
ncbi:MAG: sterol desaturase family protein [Chitinophagales bacterium]